MITLSQALIHAVSQILNEDNGDFVSNNKNVLWISKTLKNAGFQALIAGGYVRDKILGRKNKDIDFTTDATPEEIEQLFPKTIPLGKSFGVIVVVAPDGEQFEIASFRSESDYKDGRRPSTVKLEKSPKIDASRRDFTVNSMFEDPETGDVLDYYGGKEDITNKQIRAVGDPNLRFGEDKLRMLRAVRFSVVLGFHIDEETIKAIKNHKSEINEVSGERIREEFSKMFSHGDPRKCVEVLDETGLLEEILPEVFALKGVTQPKIHHPEGDVFEHTLCVLDNLVGKPFITIFAGLLHDIGKPFTKTVNASNGREQFIGHAEAGCDIADKILKRLKFTNKEIDEILFIIKNHMRMHHFSEMRLDKRRMLYAEPYFNSLLDVSLADSKSSEHTKEVEELISSIKEISKFSADSPLISGKDLVELGLSPGPKFSEILSKIRSLQLMTKINTHEEAINYVRKYFL